MMDAENQGQQPEKPNDEGFPGILASLGWVVLFLLLQVLAGAMTFGIAAALDDSGRDLLQLTGDLKFIAGPTIASLIASNVMMLGLIWLYLRKNDRAERIGLNRWSQIDLLPTIGWAIGLIALGLALNYAYATYVIPDVKVQEALRKLFAALPDTPTNKVMLFVAVALVAPLVEELVFRGLLQNALAKRLPIWAAILAASAIFAAVHMDFHAFPALMAMGAVFGILYHKTGSLRVNILAHIINNAAALLLS